MAKLKVIPDTDTFHFFNANPKCRRTGDCVVRAISSYLGRTWECVYVDLAYYGIEHGTAMDCPETYVGYLKQQGHTKLPMPRRDDNTRYTAAEFCKEIAKPGRVYLLSLAGHLTFVGVDRRIWDTWDCGGKSVGNYWVY